MSWWMWLIIILVALVPFQKHVDALNRQLAEKNKDKAQRRARPAEESAASPLSATSECTLYHWPALGAFEYNIVGTSFYQAALKKIAGDHANTIARVNTVAHLIPDPTNPHDDKAVRVDIGGQTVGHLSRDDARSFRRRLGAKKLGPVATSCDAEVWGGNVDRNGKQWGYGVKLDIKPFGW